MLCGAGRHVINPEVGHHLAGYGPDYPNTGVHDDLTVTALYLHDGKTDALLLNFDLIGMRLDYIRGLRAAVARATNVGAARIFLTNTHTHSGPEVRSYPERNVSSRARTDYDARLMEWAGKAAAEAKSTAETCTLHYNFDFASENMNRRFSLPDRQHLYIPQYKQLLGKSPEFVDRELGIVAFRKKGTPNRYKALITNYTCHPLCVGNASNLCSADFQGALRRTVEATFEGALCLTTTGAAGNNHPLTPESGFSAAEKMGGALGNLAINRTYDSIEVGYDTRLRLAYKSISLPARDKATTRLLPEQEDWKRVPWRMSKGGPKAFKTELGLLGIGPILLVALPGELVAELGAAIKWSSPFLKTYHLYQATDNAGYIVTANQFLWGGYEAVTSPYAQGSGEKLTQAILDTAHGLLLKTPLNLPPRGKSLVGY